ncbi:MAG: SRPBCC family protein [Acidimicrobiia bacterium]
MNEYEQVVSVERFVPAPPEAIFELLVDPDRHHDIDGSGTVVGAKQGSQRLRLGSRFGMSMRVKMSYSMVSTVIEFDEPRLIAWQTRGPGNLGGGRIWRYELQPVEGGTLVRESWDITRESVLSKWMVKGLGEKTRENMAATLDRIAEHFAKSS